MNLSKKYTDILYWLSMIGIVLWFVYSKGWILANFDFVDAKKAIYMLEHDRSITLLDVRTKDEFRQGHLKDAINIPVGRLTKDMKLLTNMRENFILVYCRSGSRSVSASRVLEQSGFKPINVEGGIIQLMGAGVQLVK